MKKIVVVSEYFYPAQRNDAYLITKIAEAFSKKNSVDVICTSQLEENSEELNTISGKILRLNDIKIKSTSVSIKVLKLILISMKLTFKSLFHIKKNDDVFTATNPAFFLPILILLKKIKGFHLTLLVYDVFPENLVATKLLKPHSFIYKFILKIYNWAYVNVDRFVVIGRDMEEVVRLKLNSYQKEIQFIPNWCSTNEIVPTEKRNNEIIQHYSLENKVVFSFVGNMGLVQGIENILKSTLLVQNEKFIFVFIGDGALKNTVVQFIQEHNSANIIYAGKYPSSKQNIFLNACDVSVMSLDKSMYGIGVPSKSYYNMAAQKPLLFIGHQQSEIARVINENNIGWVVEAGNPQKLAQVFDFICEQESKFKDMGLIARSVCLNSYSEENILKKYQKLY